MATSQRSRLPKQAERPSVALIIETSFGSGRNILRGIARYAKQHGPWLFHHEWRNTDQTFPEWLEEWRGDGVIARVENERVAKALRRLGVPVVDVLAGIAGAGFPLVHVDDAAIARMGATHLLDRGFVHFAFCGFKSEVWAAKRRDAFVRAISDEGFSASVFDWDGHSSANWSLGREQKRLGKWLRGLPKPLGLMACNDLQGNLVLEACQSEGIIVPDDVAVLGVDNDEPLCEVMQIPLSSVVPDDQRVGFEAAALLDCLMQKKHWNKKPVYIPPRGVVTRLSTDILAVDDVHVSTAAAFIRDHAREGITVDDVARKAAISRTLLQRRFREALGRSLHDEIINVRLRHACFLLEEGNMPLAVIAEKSGFKHQEYMGAVFKKKLGKTPMQYRKASRLPP